MLSQRWARLRHRITEEVRVAKAGGWKVALGQRGGGCLPLPLSLSLYRECGICLLE